MTPLSWEHWIERYGARGFRVLAPAWPGMDGDIGELRRHRLIGLTLTTGLLPPLLDGTCNFVFLGTLPEQRFGAYDPSPVVSSRIGIGERPLVCS